MMSRITAALAVALLCFPISAHARDGDVVTSGYVVRGVKTAVGGAVRGAAGTATGTSCDFSEEEVDQTGRLTGASVQCEPNGKIEDLLKKLPSRFDSYCAVDASRLKSARLISSSLANNPQHCDLSAIKPSDAKSTFGGAMWKKL